LLGVLARKDWEEALAAIAQRLDSDLPAWTTDRFVAELAPYFAEHPAIVTTPLARNPRNTVIKPSGPRLWDVEQRLVDPQGDEDWAIYARVDLTTPPATEEAPLIELVRVGR
ncbi:MAG TPA: DUF3516 domain-containing protein, partial [Polyangia bacterium]|nr:DUF3516 domain-containing protein [Polyangia bacterium]